MGFLSAEIIARGTKAFSDEHLYSLRKKELEYLEMFAAAYLKVTNLDPRDAILVQESVITEKGLELRWYFKERPKT